MGTRIANPRPQQIYDLTLIGLWWMRVDYPPNLIRLGIDIVNAMIKADVLPQNTTVNRSLIELTIRNSENVDSGISPCKLRQELDASDHDLIFLVRGPRRYIVDLYGHGFVITTQGIARAERVYSSNYRQYITKRKFAQAWNDRVHTN